MHNFKTNVPGAHTSDASRISKLGLGGSMVLEKWISHYTVMDLERGIVAFPPSLKECRTDVKVVALCPSENLKRALLLFLTQRMAAIMRSRAPSF